MDNNNNKQQEQQETKKTGLLSSLYNGNFNNLEMNLPVFIKNDMALSTFLISAGVISSVGFMLGVVLGSKKTGGLRNTLRSKAGPSAALFTFKALAAGTLLSVGTSSVVIYGLKKYYDIDNVKDFALLLRGKFEEKTPKQWLEDKRISDLKSKMELKIQQQKEKQQQQLDTTNNTTTTTTTTTNTNNNNKNSKNNKATSSELDKDEDTIDLESDYSSLDELDDDEKELITTLFGLNNGVEQKDENTNTNNSNINNTVTSSSKDQKKK